MTDVEALLVETLETAAEAGTVTFTVDDVVVATSASEPFPPRQHRYPIAVAAAVLVLVASWVLLRSVDPSDTVATTPTTDPEVIAPTGRPMALERLTDQPTLLGPGAVVLEAESVGRVEVGSSPLGGDEEWLADARCVASDVVVACIGDAQPNGAPRVFVRTEDQDSYGGLRGQPRDTSDSPFVVYTEPSPTGAIFISDLAPEVVTVALVSDEPLTQQAIAGTAVFPLRSDPTDSMVKFRGFDGSGVLSMVFEVEIVPPDISELVGRLEVEAIDLSWDLRDGVDAKTLRLGPGRYRGTAKVGEAGNVAIAGHRTTWGAPFGRLDELLIGDEIRISSGQQRFVYVVIAQPDGQAFAVVEPSDTSVVADTGSALLTLTTHDPEFSARRRLIVQAELIGDPTGPSSADPDADDALDGLP